MQEYKVPNFTMVESPIVKITHGPRQNQPQRNLHHPLAPLRVHENIHNKSDSDETNENKQWSQARPNTEHSSGIKRCPQLQNIWNQHHMP